MVVRYSNMESSHQTKTRMPLTERTAQFPTPRRRRMDSSKQQRTYGKQGYSAASRAVLKDSFIDENEVEEQLMPGGWPEETEELDVKTKGHKNISSRASRVGKEKNTGLGIIDEQDLEGHLARLSLKSVPSRAGPRGKLTQKALPISSELVKYLKPLLQESAQDTVIDFTAWTEGLSKAFKFIKVAEGAYGEVYKLQEKKATGARTRSTLANYGGAVIKVVPLRARDAKHVEYSTIAAVVRETRVLKTMDAVHGFTRFRGFTIVQGKYPDLLLDSFRLFKEEGGDCENDDPAEEFSDEQVYAVMEMGDAGMDLDRLRKPSVFLVYDIFWSTVILLAIAEEQVEFEHRDMHIGNICIKPWTPGGTIDVTEQAVSSMSSIPYQFLGLSGVRTTVIDYTLSRANIDADKSDIVFDPMKDDLLFKGQGKNEEETCQYNTYRHMRHQVDLAHKAALKANPKINLRGNPKWARFVPRTNVVWLSYILSTLLRRANQQYVPNSSAEALAVQKQMYGTFEEVIEAVDVAFAEDLPESARDLLVWAQGSGWLSAEEINAFKEKLENDE